MKKPFYKKWWFIAIIVFLALGAIGNAMDGKEDEAKNEVVSKNNENEVDTSVDNAGEWEAKIDELVKNEDAATDKFYALEKIMMDYEATSEEVDSFKKIILKAYQDKNYLNNPTDHQIMLTQIFQSYIVEQKSEDAWKDFAFDFHQNIKYVYRGADTPDSDAVKANEAQMDKALNELK